MAWTSSDLEQLEKAMASGARRVKYADREVEYRSLEEMRQQRNDMRRELGITKSEGSRIYLSTSKGLDGRCRE